MKGIVFDLGHTLMEFQAEWDDVFLQGRLRLQEFLKAHGLPVPPEFIENFEKNREQGYARSDQTHVEHTAEQALLRSFREFQLNGAAKKLVREALEAYFAPEVERWNRYPDSLPVLETLRGLGYRIGLISNATDHSFVLRCAERIGVTPYLDPIISSAEFLVRKPHPDIFLQVANLWGMEPEQMVMVGDQLYYDVYGARQVRMKAIWMKRDTDKAYTYIPESVKQDSLLIPDAVANSLSEIPEILQSFS